MKKYEPLENFLLEFKAHPLFPELSARFKHQRPKIPVFNSKTSNDDDWKIKSGMQVGFDLCLSLLNIRGEDL